MKRLENEWRSYRQAVVPNDAGATQVEESRRAFYAGAAAFNGIVMRMLSPEANATAEDVVKMGELEAELMEFNLSIEQQAGMKSN